MNRGIQRTPERQRIVDPHPRFVQRVGAEFIGTFGLVLSGCGAQAVEALTGRLSHLGVALAFGMSVMILVATLSRVSGAHVNPAVTIALALVSRFRWADVPGYIAAQLAGAAVGSYTLYLLLGGASGLGAIAPTVSAPRAVGVEVLLTASLMFCIAAVGFTRATALSAGVAVGATVAVGALWGGPLTGAAMNPARAFGPALLMGWQDQWIYWCGPIVGAAIGAGICCWLLDWQSTGAPSERGAQLR